MLEWNGRATGTYIDGQILGAQCTIQLELNAQVLDQLDLEIDHIDGQTILWNLSGTKATQIAATLIHGHIVVPQSGKECGTGERGGSAAKQSDLLVRLRQRLGVRRTPLTDTHLLEHLGGELLQAANVDGTRLGGLQIATAHTEIAGGTDHAAGQSQWIVREDCLGGTIEILVGNARDEALDVQLRGTGLLARRIGAFQAASGLLECSALRQCRVLDVLEVVGQRAAGGGHVIRIALPVFLVLLGLIGGHDTALGLHARIEGQEILHGRGRRRRGWIILLA